MLFDQLERVAIQHIKNKFSVHTEVVGEELIVTSLYDSQVVHQHRQSLEPIIDAVLQRIEGE